ncbi:MAG: cache domain-containing protein [Deltaproteobacteria bacterium]|nr:cache domain-containing protein [Deltaproteobacteria bacterium]
MNIFAETKNRLLKMSLQNRLVAGFMIAAFLTGFVATVISIWTINKSTIDEVQNRVRQDINTAKLIYNNTMDRIASQIQIIVEGHDLGNLIKDNNFLEMENLTVLIETKPRTQISNDQVFLDMLTLTDASGKVLYRAANPQSRGDNILWDPLVRNCLEKKSRVSSTELMSIAHIIEENPYLSRRAKTDIIKTPLSADIRDKQLSEGMVMRVAYPIMDKTNRLLGVVVGGILLNGDNSIVDKVKETVYHNEKYKGRDIGVATIFQGGIRIATNVMTKNNERAIGTILNKQVYERVIVEGQDWVGRAFVVDDWYITTYTPIFNMDEKIIGILYVGLLESKYTDIKWRTIWITTGITVIGMFLAFIISLRLGNTIITRIKMLKEASEAIAAGNLDYKLSPDKISGFDMLDEAFNYMTQSLKNRDDRLQAMHQQLAQTEKLTALGGMSAGIAHEINNPLGGILLYSNLVAEDIPADSPAHKNIEKIIYQANRCKNIVQNLLDFARTATGEMLPLQINAIIHITLNLIKGQSMFHSIEIKTELADNLPDVIGDMSRLEEVFLNLFINAADAMDEKGQLTITTKLNANNEVVILVSDTGTGIKKEDMPRIFEPFFTTKDPGKGTGLGLALAYGVIRNHKGTINIETEAGKGTTFIISLPTTISEQFKRIDENFVVM